MKPLLNAVALVVAAGAMTVSAPALSASLSADASASALLAPIRSASPSSVKALVGVTTKLSSAGQPGAANALERLSEMKIRHAELAESLQNIQIEAHIKAVEKKMSGGQGVSSARIPVVSLLTCSSGTNHCAATLLLSNQTRIPAYPGTTIGNGLKIVGVTDQGVLAARDGSSRFYLPFSGGVTSPSQPAGFGSQGPASTLPPPVLGGAMNTRTPPAGMLPAGMQSPSSFSGGMH